MDTKKKRGLNDSPSAPVSPQIDAGSYKSNGTRCYGISCRGIRSNFVPPVKSNGNSMGTATSRIAGWGEDAIDDSTKRCLELLCGPDGELPEKLRNLEPRLIKHVSNEIMDSDPNVRWNDIAGLEHAKKCVTEMVIWPLLRPDIFKGCRSPGRGLLLFGPPGTGATNRPQELDEAARRRLTKRLYIPLPTTGARAWIIKNLLEKDKLFNLSKEEIDSICKLTEGYSGSDMKNLVKDASMGPLREALRQGIEITNLKKEDTRLVNLLDFKKALQEVRPSVSLNELGT